MTGTDNKDLIRRYLQAIDANTVADWLVIDEFVAEDFVSRTPPLPGVTTDREGLKRAADIFRDATPGTHEIVMQIAEDDLVVTYVLGRGIHAGDLMGIPATAKPVEAAGIAIHRVRDGKIVEYWAITDVAGILQQIGALRTPAAAG